MMKKILFLFISIILFNCHKKNQLSDMNNIEMPLYEELKYNTNSHDTLKILVLGNSITSHGIAKNIGWNHKSGMAASDIGKDYVHLLFDMMTNKYPSKNILLRYSNWSQFERNPEAFNGYATAINFNPNILIFQLSDNLTPESYDSFSKHSIDFLKSFNNKFVVSPFFMNASNYNVSREISLKSNAYFIDISNISRDKLNRAFSDSNRNDISDWKSEGISQHPGNIGMSNISKAIFNVIILKN